MRKIVITFRLNEREYQYLNEILEKFNSNKKLPFRNLTMSELLRILIVWEHERLIEQKT